MSRVDNAESAAQREARAGVDCCMAIALEAAVLRCGVERECVALPILFLLLRLPLLSESIRARCTSLTVRAT